VSEHRFDIPPKKDTLSPIRHNKNPNNKRREEGIERRKKRKTHGENVREFFPEPIVIEVVIVIGK